MKSIEKAERYTLSNLVVQNLKQYILEHRVSPGEKLPAERELAQMMNVSRAILREALRSLESTGVLDIRHGEGAFVSNQSLAPLLEQLAFSTQLRSTADQAEERETRYLLEAAAVEMMLSRDMTLPVAEWEQAASSVGRPEWNDAQRLQAEIAFHLAIVKPLGNSSMSQLIETFLHLTAPLSIRQFDAQQHARDHLQLVELLRERDAAAVKQWLYRHVHGTNGLA